MEIMTPLSLWKDYNPEQLPLEISVIKTNKASLYFRRDFYYTACEGENGTKVRVFASYYYLEGQTRPTILYCTDPYNPIKKNFIEYWLSIGYNVLIPDYTGVNPETSRYTIYPKGMSFGNFYSNIGNLYSIKGSLVNTGWYVWAVIMRRAVTFLIDEKTADTTKIAVIGEGIGGSTVWKLSALDERIKCSAILFDGSSRSKQSTLDIEDVAYMASLSAQSYSQQLKTPLLLMLASNEKRFKADEVSDLYALIKSKRMCYLSVSERTDHIISFRQKDNLAIWLYIHLFGDGKVPEAPYINARSSDGWLYYDIKVDNSFEVDKVEVFYTNTSSLPHTRDYMNLKVETTGENEYIAKAEVLSMDMPVYAFANVLYKNGLSLSTKIIKRMPREVEIEKATTKPSRLMYENSNGTDSFTTFNEKSVFIKEPPVVMDKGPFDIEGVTGIYGDLATYKISDPRYMAASDQNTLQLTVFTPEPQGITVEILDCNNNKYSASFPIEDTSAWQKIDLIPKVLKNAEGQSLGSWGKAVCIRMTADKKFILSNMLWI